MAEHPVDKFELNRFLKLFPRIMHMQVFYKLMADSGRLNDTEINLIFGNWKELMACNTRFQK